MDQQLLNEVASAISSYRLGFYIWSVVFYTLCAAILALPIIIASGLLSDRWTKIVAVISAFCAAIATWSNLGVIVGNFGKAFTSLEIARAQYYVDPNKRQTLVDEYAKAKNLVINWSPGLPEAAKSDK